MGARKLSTLKPTMDANGVNMVAIGLEQLGAQDFVNGNFFDGGMCMHNACACAKFWLYGVIGKQYVKCIPIMVTSLLYLCVCVCMSSVCMCVCARMCAYVCVCLMTV